MLGWLLCIMPINWLRRALMTQKILIIQILGKMMKWMMDGIGSISMTFRIKASRQLPFCLIRRPHHLQWQQQVSQKIIPWWGQSSKNSLNPTFKPMKTGENRHLRKVVSVAFKDTISETAFKNLLTKVTLPENCKFAQAKLVNPVVFASVSPSLKSTDIKLQEVQRNMSKMAAL